MVTIKNLTQKNTIFAKAKIAHSFFDRSLGLLNPHNPRYLIFKTHFGIHTFFMTQPIDVLLLNQESRVVKLKRSLSPFRFFLYHPQFSILIEMPQGTIEKSHIKINDKISIE